MTAGPLAGHSANKKLLLVLIVSCYLMLLEVLWPTKKKARNEIQAANKRSLTKLWTKSRSYLTLLFSFFSVGSTSLGLSHG